MKYDIVKAICCCVSMNSNRFQTMAEKFYWSDGIDKIETDFRLYLLRELECEVALDINE